MSIQKVRDYFAQWGMADRVMELDQSSATVEEAAAALHTEGRRIAKSMSFLIGDHPILVLSPVMPAWITISSKNGSTRKRP